MKLLPLQRGGRKIVRLSRLHGRAKLGWTRSAPFTAKMEPNKLQLAGPALQHEVAGEPSGIDYPPAPALADDFQARITSVQIVEAV